MAKGAKSTSRATQSRNVTTKTRARSAASSGAKKRASTRPNEAKPRRSAATKVMGVTIPKGFTNALDNLVNSPRGREILASAIVAAAGGAPPAPFESRPSSQPAKGGGAAAGGG